jgi:hypothetical protein
MSYLQSLQEKVRQLQSLIADFKAIAGNTQVALDHRYQLVMAPACVGRIQALFGELNIDYPAEHYDARCLGYQSALELTLSDIESSAASLAALLEPQAPAPA